MEHHLTATECHWPYGITQCYLPLDTSDHTSPSPQPRRDEIRKAREPNERLSRDFVRQ